MEEEPKKAFMEAQLLTDFRAFVSLVCNNPLYSAYLLFFTPCFLRLLLFLCPLLLSTTLLLLVLLTVSPQLENAKFRQDIPARVETPACPTGRCFLVGAIVRLAELFKEQMGGEVEVSFWDVLDIWSNNAFEYNPEAYADRGEEAKGSSLVGTKSMKKVREWKRTLACKLYEEKQNKWRETLGGKLIVDDGFVGLGEEFNGEGMDLLWEVYEESGKGKVKALEREVSHGRISREDSKRSVASDYSFGRISSRRSSCGGDHEREEEEEDEPETPFCCLSALKFSTRKMSLGMSKPNLVKFSKTLKGFGLFKNVHKTKSSKKSNS
ncbi:uncharacterized protein LOC116250707 [Nymphaea colorata]|uniref:Uncharacterized protein n=1 Tax=Nymphaea colorata TaxID=210225 RepID=A0A5K1B835_9MAGN|nr:uncharacterized protein LOC116250707 [Nymphaea colorata]